MIKIIIRQAVIWIVAIFLAAPMDLMAQTGAEDSNAEQSPYTQEQLDQLLAPIALYPDSLLAQILMAATYPLEVVEADRWCKANPDLTDQELDDALLDQPWDESVKSLCHFPQILATMSEKIDETNELGNAFLGQQNEVMDTIQNLRAKARDAGQLTSTDKQNVIVEGGDIRIEPVEPEVVYVPAYDPCQIYGPWWYPDCSPPWFWYPDLAVGIGFTFGPPIFIGPIGGWCGFHWHRHQIFVDVNKTNFFNRVGVTRMHGGMEVWRHRPSHRRGLEYFNGETARRFGRMPRPGVEARHAFRGFPRQGEISGRHGTPEGPGPSRQGNIQRREGFPFFSPGPREPGGGHAFEGFGRNRNEISNFSHRGHESMGSGMGRGQSRGGFQGGGVQRSFGGHNGRR